jgi:hypothetical protein
MLVALSAQRPPVVLFILMYGKFISQKHLHSRHSSLGVLAKLSKVTVSFIMSVSVSVRLFVRHDGTAQLSLDGFSRNLVFEYFYKICQEN